MSSRKIPTEFSHESIENNETLQKIFDEIILGFKNQRLTLGSNKNLLNLDLSNKLTLELKLKVRESGKSKLFLKLEWKNKPLGDGDQLTIEAFNK